MLLYGASSLDYAASFYFCFVLYQPTEEEETKRVNKGRQKTGNNLEFLPTFWRKERKLTVSWWCHPSQKREVDALVTISKIFFFSDVKESNRNGWPPCGKQSRGICSETEKKREKRQDRRYTRWIAWVSLATPQLFFRLFSRHGIVHVDMLDVYSCYGPIWVKILSNKKNPEKKRRNKRNPDWVEWTKNNNKPKNSEIVSEFLFISNKKMAYNIHPFLVF